MRAQKSFLSRQSTAYGQIYKTDVIYGVVYHQANRELRSIVNIHWQQGNNSEQSPLGTWWCYIGNKVWIKETREHIWFGTSTFLRSAHAWNATWYTVNSLNMKPPRLWMYSAVGVLYNSSSVIPIITFSALSLVDSTDDHPLDCSTSSIIYSTERKIS